MAGKLGHEDDDQDLDQNKNVDDPNDDTDESAQAKPEVDPNLPVVVEESEEDRRLATSDEGEGDDADVAQDTERNTRKRETAKERRERARQAKERDKQEIEILRRTVAKQNERLTQIDQSLTVTRVTDLDNRLATAISEAENFQKIEVRATIAKNEADALTARRLAEEAKQRAWALHNEKEMIIKQARTPPAPEPVPYAQKAVNFLKDKQWYNPKSGDEDSLVVEAIDRALSKQMDPNSDQYWETLDRKVKEKLPHRFAQNRDDASDEDGDDEPVEPTPQRRKGPPTGGSNRSSGNGSAKTISLPREMVEAMKEAGHWDDPVKRARVAKRYVEGLKNRNG